MTGLTKCPNQKSRISTMDFLSICCLHGTYLERLKVKGWESYSMQTSWQKALLRDKYSINQEGKTILNLYAHRAPTYVNFKLA